MLPTSYIEMIKSLLGDEAQAYFDALKQTPTRGLRFNTLKGGKIKETDLPIEIKPLPYGENAYAFSGGEHIGNHPLHHAGAFYVQEPSAIAPVACADIRPGMRVLDLCASPGGKSTQIAARLCHDGLLVSNEAVFSRVGTLSGNLERLGVRNAIVTHAYAHELCAALPDFFDVIVVDAPCSGEGMFRKNPAAANEWSPAASEACAKRQLEILDAAAPMLKAGGELIYSTCTFSLCENEEAVAAFLQAHPEFSLCEVPDAVKNATCDGIQIEENTANFSKTRRFYPHKGEGEGQFMAKLKKSEDAPKAKRKGKDEPHAGKPLGKAEQAAYDAFIKEALVDTASLPAPRLFKDAVWLPVQTLPLSEKHLYAYGVKVGDLRKGRLVPHHHFFTAYGAFFKRKLSFSLADVRLTAFLRGETVSCELANGWAIAEVEGLALGGIKVTDGIAKNHYPAGLRDR